MKKGMLLLVLFGVLVTSAQAESFISLGGYYKIFFVVFNPPRWENSTGSGLPERAMGMVNNRLRLNLFSDLGHWISFSLAYCISPRIQDPSLFDQGLFLVDFDLFQYRFIDLKSQLNPRDDEPSSFAIFQNLDRAFFTIKTGPVDIFIGRQAIAWGSARAINPTDIIASFSFQELDTEDRVGVDAVRVRVPLGFMGELDTGYVFGEDFKFEKSAFYIRSKFYVARTDGSLLLLGFQRNLLAGLDIARSLGGAGFWIEAAYVFVDVFDNDRHTRKNDYFRSTVGLDYSFSGNTYVFIEYHFSGAGTNKPEEYLKNFARPGRPEGAVYLMGKHYLIPGLSYQITPLIMFSGEALFNLSDLSLFLAPQVEYNISQNIYLSAGAFVGMGETPECLVGEDLIPAKRFRSEFGGYPDTYFTSFRIYF